MNEIARFGGRWAGFVWSAYGVSALVFVLMILDSLLRARRHRREVARLERELGE